MGVAVGRGGGGGVGGGFLQLQLGREVIHPLIFPPRDPPPLLHSTPPPPVAGPEPLVSRLVVVLLLGLIHAVLTAPVQTGFRVRRTRS